MFSKIKTIIKFIARGFLSLIGLLLVLVVLFFIIQFFDRRTPEEVRHQYCLEDGDCYEGDTIFDGDIGKEIVITKKYCIENNYEWHEENKMCKTSYNEPWKVNACLDKGGCWDYIRHRCEMNDQGYCERNEQDCIGRKGIWDADKKYCNLQDN